MHEVAPEVYVFVGQEQQSVATAFVAGHEALLVDTLASAEDAQALRDALCAHMGKRVSTVLITHYMSDHLGGLHLYPGAEVLAHAHHMHTYLSQGHRNAHVERNFIRPTRVIRDGMDLVWGGHLLRIFHNPGHTVSTLNIDVPALDLLLTSDNLVGHIAYVSHSAPDLLDAALARIERRDRKLLVPGHIGVQAGEAARHARSYLRRLADEVQGCRDEGGVLDAVRLRQIGIETCRTSSHPLTDFEREWHGHNLTMIGTRDLFPRGAAGTLEPLALSA